MDEPYIVVNVEVREWKRGVKNRKMFNIE